MNKLEEVGWICDKPLRTAVKEMLYKYPEYLKQPASISGKYHQGDSMRMHIRRAVHILAELLKEHNITGYHRDLLLGATILHDIGKIKGVVKGEKSGRIFNHEDEVYEDWKYYKNTGYSCCYNLMEPHPLIGASIVKNELLGKLNKEHDPMEVLWDWLLIGELVEHHMSHWYLEDKDKKCNNLYCVLVQSADYLASRDNIIVKMESD